MSSLKRLINQLPWACLDTKRDRTRGPDATPTIAQLPNLDRISPTKKEEHSLLCPTCFRDIKPFYWTRYEYHLLTQSRQIIPLLQPTSTTMKRANPRCVVCSRVKQFAHYWHGHECTDCDLTYHLEVKTHVWLARVIEHGQPICTFAFSVKWNFEDLSFRIENADISLVDLGSIRRLVRSCDSYSRRDLPLFYNSRPQFPTSFKLVFLETRSVVTPGNYTPPYAAVAHFRDTDTALCLNISNYEMLSQHGALDTDQLPISLRESFEICEKLGFKFVWIEQFCVLHDSPSDIKTHYPLRNVYYHHADVALFISKEILESSVSPGHIFRYGAPSYKWWPEMSLMQHFKPGSWTPDQDLFTQHNTLKKADWTFDEERAARRRLYFCATHTRYVCDCDGPDHDENFTDEDLLTFKQPKISLSP